MNSFSQHQLVVCRALWGFGVRLPRSPCPRLAGSLPNQQLVGERLERADEKSALLAFVGLCAGGQFGRRAGTSASMLLPGRGEVEAEEHGEQGADFMGLATVWFAHKMAKIGISGAPRCRLVRGCASPSRRGLPSLRGSGILYVLQDNYSYPFL